MSGLRYTLLADGTSDNALLRPIDWALEQRDVETSKRVVADLSAFVSRHSPLDVRLSVASQLYPDTHLFFVHRDAETAPLDKRVDEIRASAARQGRYLPIVPVVPVRMSETWLLIDEAAIRTAAGNPKGRTELKLPALARLEGLPDAKAVLFDLLRTAAGFGGRRKLTLSDLGRMRYAVADHTSDWAPLRKLPSFQAFEAALDAERLVERFKLAQAGR